MEKKWNAKEVPINYVCVGAWKLWENCQKVNVTHNLIYIQNVGSNFGLLIIY